MPLTDAGKAIALNALCRATNPPSSITHVGLLDETETELANGNPAYARKASNFNAADTGACVTAADLTFDVPAGKTVAHVAYFTAINGGTKLGSDPVTNEAFAGQGQYKVLAGTEIALTDPA